MAAAVAMLLTYGSGAAFATGKDKGGGGSGSKGGSAQTYGDFDNQCTEFDGGSDKDISNVQVFYTDGTSSKEEFQDGKKTYSHDAPEGKTIDRVVIKSGNKSDTYRCPECQDNKDNDGDGKIDYDKDGDGARDADSDPDCDSEDDPTEGGGGTPQCRDGVDNDGDGKIDHPADPGCTDPDDNTESPDPNGAPQCSDTADNDGDGKIDAEDPGCINDGVYDPNDDNETDNAPECSDGRDNADPEDQLADAADPGCKNDQGVYDPNDPSEVDQNGGEPTFTCRASALRVDDNALLIALGEDPLEPVVANADQDPCATDNGTLIDTEDNISGPPGSLRAQVLEAETSDADGGNAEASVAHVTIADSTGAPIVEATAVESSATSRCTGGEEQFTGESTIATLFIAGESVEVTGDTNQAITIPGVGTLFLNYQDFSEDGTTITQRAIFLDTTTPLGDVIVAESIADVHDC